MYRKVTESGPRSNDDANAAILSLMIYTQEYSVTYVSFRKLCDIHVSKTKLRECDQRLPTLASDQSEPLNPSSDLR